MLFLRLKGGGLSEGCEGEAFFPSFSIVVYAELHVRMLFQLRRTIEGRTQQHCLAQVLIYFSPAKDRVSFIGRSNDRFPSLSSPSPPCGESD